MRKYLISGIGPGLSGVGRLMTQLVPEYQAKGYHVITRRANRSVRELIAQNKYINLAREIFHRCFGDLFFGFRCLTVLNSKVVFLHPQTAGYGLFLYLACFNNLSLYVMDNSFFCIRSYNTHPLAGSECLQCLGEIMPHQLCAPFPVGIPKKINIFYLQLFKRMSSRLRFMAQNNLQANLLIAHFGENINCSVVGMNAESNELLRDQPASAVVRFDQLVRYDVVFHGASHVAKGLLYVLQLAELMPEFSFLIPDEFLNVSRIAKHSPSANVCCELMNWETGLREVVASARLVINPSMWSAPIEGALIKSAKFNKNVATVESQYGYEAEIETIANHLRLPLDPILASGILRVFLSEIQ